MPRFRKGTTDHDNDGRMGGSMKETDMVKVKGTTAAEKKVARAPAKGLSSGRAIREMLDATRPEPEAKPATKARSQADIEAADLEHSIGRHPGGMEPPLDEEAAKVALAAQFAAADGKGDPRFDEIQAGLAVRGY